jgi:hypothetical protein
VELAKGRGNGAFPPLWGLGMGWNEKTRCFLSQWVSIITLASSQVDSIELNKRAYQLSVLFDYRV